MGQPDGVSGELIFLTGLLNQPGSTPLDPEIQQDLLWKGSIARLEELSIETGASQPVLDALSAAASQHPSSGIRNQAFRVLSRLCEAGYQPAIDTMVLLAVEQESIQARQEILANGWSPSSPPLSAALEWLDCLISNAAFPQDQLHDLTAAYFQIASQSLRRRMVQSAPGLKIPNWGLIVTSIELDAMDDLVSRFSTFSSQERLLAVDLVSRQAEKNSLPAREAVCQLFIQHAELQAKVIALKEGYVPEDPEQRALFLFLAEQWTAYNNLDFNRNLLINAYENASRPVRRRLLEHSRHTGQMEWIQGAGLAGEARWIGDLTDGDWELTVRSLFEQGNYQNIWQLAQFAPPHWSALILPRLAAAGWEPGQSEERSGFQTLVSLAQACAGSPLGIRSRKKLNHPMDDITCLAVDPAGKHLAAGGSGQEISIWNLPEGNLASTFAGPSRVTRALAFSPDGTILATAAGDQRIRSFRLQDGMIQKTLEGHKAQVRSLFILPDGRMLVSAGFDGTIRMWRFPFGPEIKTLEPGEGEILSLASGSGGRFMLSAGVSGNMMVWALPEGLLTRQIQAHAGGITHLAAGINSDLAASAGRDGWIRVWNFTSGGMLRGWRSSGSPLTAMAIHPSEMTLASGHQDGSLVLWSVSTGSMIEKVTKHHQPVTGLAFSPDGSTLFSSDGGARVEMWDLQTFLMLRLPGMVSRPGAAAELQDWLKKPGLPPAEKTWLAFASGLALWRARYDIEVSDFLPIPVGEFDIELS